MSQLERFLGKARYHVATNQITIIGVGTFGSQKIKSRLVRAMRSAGVQGDDVYLRHHAKLIIKEFKENQRSP